MPICGYCKKDKPVTAFKVKLSRPNGLTSLCSHCRGKAQQRKKRHGAGKHKQRWNRIYRKRLDTILMERELGTSVAEIGTILGITRKRVSQIMSEARTQGFNI